MKKNQILIILTCITLTLGCISNSQNTEDDETYLETQIDSTSTVPPFVSLDDLLNKVKKANSNIQSAQVRLSSEVLVNEIMDGESESSRMNLQGQIHIDKTKKKLMSQIETTLYYGQQYRVVKKEFYINNGHLYFQDQDKWIKTKDTGELWKNQNYFQIVLDLLESKEIERLTDEWMEEKSYYLLHITPDLETAKDILIQTQNEMPELNSYDFQDIIKQYEVKLWINKATYHVEKQQVQMILYITDDNTGVIQPDVRDYTIDMLVKTTGYFNKINQDQEIIVPSNIREKAIDLTK